MARPGKVGRPRRLRGRRRWAEGRYRLTGVGKDNNQVVVIDTTTGQCWGGDAALERGDWTDLGNPAKK